MRISHSLSIIGLVVLALVGSSTYALPSAPPAGSSGYTGGLFSYYFKNIIEGNGTVGTTTAGACAIGKAITGFSVAPGTYGLPICGTVASPQYWTSANSGVDIYFTGTNVGIGTATPGAKFDVVGGDARINGVTVGMGSGNITSNTAVGSGALRNNTTGFLNTANGYYALYANTTGIYNTANGYYALTDTIGGGFNVANGAYALRSNTSGYNNTANGKYTLGLNLTGYHNTANGSDALGNNTAGNNNTALGSSAGSNLTSGDNNIAIGYSANFPSTTGSNQLNIGNWIYGTSGNIGIGTGTALTAKLTVAGTVQIVDGSQGSGKVLTSNAAGVGTWMSPSDMPIGAVVAFNTTTCPTGWVAADGSGASIDLRGEFIRGLDSGRGTDTGRTLGSWQNATRVFADAMGSFDGVSRISGANYWKAQALYPHYGENVTAHNGGNAGYPWGYQAVNTGDVSGDLNQAISYETRPRNVALLYCTKISGASSTPSSNVTWSNVSGTSTGNVTLATTGNVGIGTTGPTAKLEINSGVAGSGGLRFTNLTSTSATGAINGKMLTVNANGDVILVDSATVVSPNLVKLYGEAWNNAAGKINNASGYPFTVSASGRYLFDFTSTSYAASAWKTSTFSVRQGTTVLASDSDTSFNNTVHGEYSGKMEVDLVPGTTYNVYISDTGVKNSGDWDRVYYKQVSGLLPMSAVSSGMSDLPVGSIMPFNLAACPSGWIIADGTSGTPDLRGEFVRGLDNGRGVDTGRTLGSWQDQDWKGFYQQDTGINWSAGYSHYDVYMGKSTTAYIGALFTGYWSNPSAAIGTKWDTSEVRPRNVALLYCMKFTGGSTPSNNTTWTNTTGTSSGNVILATTGNVGIGTMTPGVKLEVSGQVKITGGVPGLGKVLTSDATGLATWQTINPLSAGSTGQTLRYSGTGWLASSNIFDNGTNIGIGTISPTAKLDIAGKAVSLSTTGSDIGTTLVTKDYVDERLSGMCTVVGGTWNNTTGVCTIPALYSWQIGAYGACSLSCGGGTQSATIVCKQSNGTTVADSFCAGAKPTGTSQACNTQACPVNCTYTTTGWSACSASCGGGTQSYYYSVTAAAQNGGTCAVTNGQVVGTQACNTQSCVTYTWGGISGAAGSCGAIYGGYQEILFACIRYANGVFDGTYDAWAWPNCPGLAAGQGHYFKTCAQPFDGNWTYF